MVANQPAGVDGHPVAHLHRRDVIGHRRHAAGHLMAQHHRLLDAHGVEATVVEVVQVGPADAAKPHPHQHLAGADLAGILLIQAQVGGGVDHEASTAVAHWRGSWGDEVPVTILTWVVGWPKRLPDLIRNLPQPTAASPASAENSVQTSQISEDHQG